ncbi:MAG: ribosome-associated GTPase EngA, partial [Deltaproteobacteria bacterium]|nr:ribosome-associated GTPase EngA [Deltaproteobacteria bacterium]
RHGSGAKRVKIFYMSQVAVKPPSIVLFSNYPAAIGRSYERYLINSLRERFDFEGTPVRIWSRKKSSDNKT